MDSSKKLSPLQKAKHGKDKFYLLIVTSAGLGLAPKAPGTFGTLGGVLIFAGILWLDLYSLWLLFGLACFFTILCGMLGSWMEDFFGRSDPPPVVIDEVAGYLISVMVWDFKSPILVGILAFLLFRFFDILKPYPIYLLEKLPKGWGVAFDDIGAGILGALILNGIMMIFV